MYWLRHAAQTNRRSRLHLRPILVSCLLPHQRPSPLTRTIPPGRCRSSWPAAVRPAAAYGRRVTWLTFRLARAAAPGPPGGRVRPPRHRADLPLAERRAVVAGLGQPPFRASQLSRHFFGRYTDQTDEMSDLPRAARDPLARALLPRLLTAERELSC